MTVTNAQQDIRRAYVGGGPGAIVSALVWFAAAFVAARHGIGPAFTLLFFGGMLIFPLSLLVCQFGFRRPKMAADNPLGMTALEATITMIGGLLAAWLFVRLAPAYVFPVAAMAVGTHYAEFKTAYGDRLYWMLAAILTAIGGAALLGLPSLPGAPILAVAVVELLFGLWLTKKSLAEFG
jgi:hypothetical protein